MDTWSPPTPRSGREPSWPRVLATTLQLWLKRRRRRSVYLAVVAVIAALAAGAGVALAQGTTNGGHTRRSSPPSRRGSATATAGTATATAGTATATASTATPAAGSAAPAVGSQAADWVAAQVSRNVTVACDPATCASLQRNGFPAGNLVPVHPGAPNSAAASLAVATAALRGDLGRALASRYAPVALASFGTGPGAVQIRAAAPRGPAAYLSLFRTDLATRKSLGAELLRNPAVQAGPPARQQLSEGLADPRLIATIGVMAALHPVHLVSFGDASPGASPGVPLRSVLLYGVTHGVTAGATLLASLQALLRAQQPTYRPATVQTVRLGTGQSALRIVFAAPAPLGLLDTSQPLVQISSP